VKVTPLDIRRKEFKRGMRGYADEEVDVFLDDVADEFERLFQENMELQDKMLRLDEQIAGHTQLKNALEKTLVSAQVQADQMIANARKEAELILRDAELKARHIVNDSYGETQRVQQTLVQLKHLEEDFRFKFRSLLEGHLKLLNDAPIAPPPAAAPVIDAEVMTREAPANASEADEPPVATGDATIQAEPVPTLEVAPAAEAAPLVEIVPAAAATPFPEVVPLSEPPLEYSLPEDTLTEESEAGEDVAEGVMAASVMAASMAAEANAGATIDEATAELTVETVTGQVEEEEPESPQGFYFGKRVEPDDDSFFSTEPQFKDKSREFEW
jgi:cell division initiation protein